MSTIKKPLKTSKMLTVEGTVYELGKTTINESQIYYKKCKDNRHEERNMKGKTENNHKQKAIVSSVKKIIVTVIITQMKR